MPRRSMLFAPGDRPDMMQKAVELDADSVIFDLEDSVAPSSKEDAREMVQSVAANVDTTCEVCVRINPIERTGPEDIEVVAPIDAVDTLVIPMIDDANDVRAVGDVFDSVGASEIALLPLIETAKAVQAATNTAAQAKVDGVMFGDKDFRAKVGASPIPNEEELIYARERVVTAAVAAGVGVIDTVYTDIDDLEGLSERATYARDLGFDGKTAIHPDQVDVINDAFEPVPDTIEWAKRVLEAKRSADTEDKGVFVVDGEMVDEPVLEQARTILRQAGREDHIDTNNV